jgi:Icc-related predicted phosphoesterase
VHIIATSDLHGSFPKIPECDLFLITGDLSPVRGRAAIGPMEFFHNQPKARAKQANWFVKDCRPWFQSLPARYIVFSGGNHDYFLDDPGFRVEDPEAFGAYYLQDDSVEIEGLKIYATPWVPHLANWAFHANEQTLKEKFALIPEDTDVLMSHGPPYGILDNANYPEERKLDQYFKPVDNSKHVGANFLEEAILRVGPSLFVCGHIHEHHGQAMLEDTVCANVSLMDREYDSDNFQDMLSVHMTDKNGCWEIESTEWIAVATN